VASLLLRSALTAARQFVLTVERGVTDNHSVKCVVITTSRMIALGSPCRARTPRFQRMALRSIRLAKLASLSSPRLIPPSLVGRVVENNIKK
jgi:hypothetical protein